MGQQVRDAAPPRFLRESFHRNSRCFIRRVPLDVLVDRVLLQLSLKDILRLRKVDKAFFVLTHEVTIWKHFFRQLDIPTPFFYENPARFAIDPREHECERMVARAIALEDNWHSTTPRARDVISLQYRPEILEMKILPGGRYVVASARDFANLDPLKPNPHPKYAIIILELSTVPNSFTSKIVYRVDLKQRAYRIQARFMHYQSQQGIVISYVTRTFKPSFPGSNWDLWELRYDEDLPAPMEYEWHAGFAPLAELETASKTEKKKKNDIPVIDASRTSMKKWYELAYDRREGRIDHFVLAMGDGIPVAAYIVQPFILVVHDLDATVSRMVMMDSVGPNSEVRCLRLLISRDKWQALVIRTRKDSARQHGHFVQLYDFLTNAHGRPSLSIRLESLDSPFSSFSISEPTQMSERSSSSISPNSSLSSHSLQPPISIYGVREYPRCLEHYIIRPKYADEVTPQRYIVEPDCFVPLSRYVFESFDFDAILIPAVHRPLIFNQQYQCGRRVITNLRRFLPKDRAKLRADYDGRYHFDREPLVQREWRTTWQSTRMISTISWIPDNIFAQFEQQESFCVGWDETSGRVCIATAPDGNLVIVDLATDIIRNRCLEEWKDQGRTPEHYYEGQAMFVDDIGRPYVPYIYVEA